MVRSVFVTGGTGYVGRELIARLLQRGHTVRALVRHGSASKLPLGTEALPGDALNAATWSARVAPSTTLVHLVGTPHPSPWKARQFQEVDLRSIMASVAAAVAARVEHVVYVSVAHPAPIMRTYIEARRAGEAALRGSGIPTTILRPWYVLGPGHRWPVALLPIYAVLERLPPSANAARRLGLVTLPQMVAALVQAVEDRPDGIRVVEVPAIRQASA